MAAHVHTNDFTDAVLKSDVPVLVDFYAQWCGPCRLQSPILDELATESAGTYQVVKVDVDKDPDLATKFNVTALPTLLLFADGQVMERYVGLQQKGTLKSGLQASTAH